MNRSEEADIRSGGRTLRVIATLLLAAGGAVALALLLEDATQATAAAIVSFCLILWLSEIVPPFAPTLLLIPATALALGMSDDRFSLGRVLSWGADPVLPLFLGGFVLATAAARYRIDYAIAERARAWSGERGGRLILLCAAATALLSMWISNIAAAAMMLAAVRPILSELDVKSPMRRGLLLGIAFAANVGGMATPIGTGPNGIAMASVARQTEITFLSWMGLAIPLTVAMILLALGVIFLQHRVGRGGAIPRFEPRPPEPGAGRVILLFSLTVLLWLSEPLHGIPSSVIALFSTAALFLSGILDRTDLARVDWSTLILIAGGLIMGRLLEESGVILYVSDSVPWSELTPFLLTFVLCFTAALMSALMSNTASAALLIPLALSIDPSPALSILIAMSASLGTPFVISTPPNAMVYGAGGIRFADLAVPGFILMIFGTLLISLTGRAVLQFFGIS